MIMFYVNIYASMIYISHVYLNMSIMHEQMSIIFVQIFMQAWVISVMFM